MTWCLLRAQEAGPAIDDFFQLNIFSLMTDGNAEKAQLSDDGQKMLIATFCHGDHPDEFDCLSRTLVDVRWIAS